MAARKRNGGKLTEKTRERIRVSMLLNRLTDHIEGKVELSQSQVRAIEILLRKTLPDLQSTEMHGSLTAEQPTININLAKPSIDQDVDSPANDKPKLKAVK